MPRNTNDPIRLPATPFIHPDLDARVTAANALSADQRDNAVAGAIAAAAAFALGGAVLPPQNLVNYSAAAMAPFKTALNSGSDVFIWDVGPSTVAGQSTVGSKNGTFTAVNQFRGAVANRVAQLLLAAGINASNNEFFGNHYGWGAGDTVANYLTGDDRIAFANVTAFNGTQPGGGGLLVGAAGESVSITFQDPVTQADIWFRDVSSGRSFKWSVDGGAETTIATRFDGTTFPAELRKLTVPLGAAGTHTLKLAGTGANIVYPAVLARNTAAGRALQISNVGISGATSAQLISGGTDVASRLNALTTMKPNLVIVRDWQINDWRGTAITPQQSMDNLQTWITTAKNAGAAVLGLTPLFDAGTGGNSANQEQYSDAVKALYVSNNVPYIDLRALLVSYAAADAAGFYSDNVHPSQVGYARIADLIAQFIRYVMFS